MEDSHVQEPSPPAVARRRPEGLGRWLLWCASSLLVVWPFLVVTFPPVTDLPQHAAQVHLLDEALEPGSPYDVQWVTPYALAYLPLAAGTALAGPLGGARLAVAFIALLWVGAVHLLAAKLDRPAAAAVAASVLVFHHALYWGFLPFLLGFAIFVPWLLLVRRDPRPGPQRAALFALLAILLYSVHALWLAAGLAWLGIDALLRLRRGTGWQRILPRLAGPGVVAAAAVIWFLSIRGSSFATPPLWVPPVWRRLLPSSLVEATFGGLTGVLEPAALAVLAAWLLAATWAGLRRHGRWDRPLLAAGLLFVVAALVLPDKFTNTIEFNHRWMPPGLALLLLAAPPLALRRGLARAVAATFLAVFVMVTAVTWQRAEAEELAGLEASLEALPEEPTLLGLDFLRGSVYLDREPYLQTFAWGQVLRGGELNFSFADFPPSLVAYDPPRRTPWTPGLEWYPQMVRPGDFGWFDHVLVRAPAGLHQQIAAAPFLEPLTAPAPWRLYRVLPDAPRVRFEMPPLPASHPR